MAHVKELLEQNSQELMSIDRHLDIGVYQAALNTRDTENQIIYAGIQSVHG